MTEAHAIKFFAIAKMFQDNVKQLQRGENAYTSGHVSSCTINSELEPAIIKGKVEASMKKKLTYTVEISFDLKKQETISNSCTCPRGQVVCHHQAALMYYAHYNIGSTDLKRKWGVAKKEKTTTVETIDNICGSPKKYKGLSSEVSADKIEALRAELGETNVVGFSWLLKPCAPPEAYSIVPAIESILFTDEYFKAIDKRAYFLEKCFLSTETIQQIANITIGQHANEIWLVTRKCRLTASKFGAILKACQRGKYPPSLFKMLLEGYTLERVRAIQWGKENEETAIRKFVEVTGLEVTKTGLWLDSCGFLGASPDGLVADDAILEVKCPYRFRTMSIRDGVKDKKYVFHYSENDDLVVNCNHPYYHQIQGQLHFTNCQKCYLFIWTPNDTECMIINRDEEWKLNVDILKTFYLEKFIPILLT